MTAPTRPTPQLTVTTFDQFRELREGGQVNRYHVINVVRRENNAEHSFGAALIALAFWPDVSCRLLRAILLHDVHELKTGDMPHTVKRHSDVLNRALELAEDDARHFMGLEHFFEGLSEQDQERLRVADVADAMMFGYDEWLRGNRAHGLRIMQNSQRYLARFPNAGIPYWWTHAMQELIVDIGGIR